MRFTHRTAAWAVACAALALAAGVAAGQQPANPAAAGSAEQNAPQGSAIWAGRAPQMEAHLKTAEIVSIEDIGTGVTRPRRARLKPAEPFDSLVWKMLPPGRRSGYWESYKSEIAAYELDKLLQMNMVPPAVERTINGESGAAIEWIPMLRSVKESGGKVPAGPVWGRASRRMLTFDNLIGNHDRNAGNILIGPPGEFILIDHSRAFITDTDLPNKIERVDGDLWRRIQALTRDDLARTLGSWIDAGAIDAMLERRMRMSRDIQKLTSKKSTALVVID
jgi:hypothetical protein